jgi:hypothetical protein
VGNLKLPEIETALTKKGRWHDHVLTTKKVTVSIVITLFVARAADTSKIRG